MAPRVHSAFPLFERTDFQTPFPWEHELLTTLLQMYPEIGVRGRLVRALMVRRFQHDSLHQAIYAEKQHLPL